jgi:hypothetical protein
MGQLSGWEPAAPNHRLQNVILLQGLGDKVDEITR